MVWVGEGGSAAYAAAEHEAELGRRIRSALDQVVDVLAASAGRLQSVRDNLIGKVDAAVLQGFSVGDEDWVVTDTSEAPGSERGREIRAQSLIDIQAAVSGALEQLADEDEAVAFELDRARDEAEALGADVVVGQDYSPPSTAGLSSDEVRSIIDDAEFRDWVDRHPDAAKAYLDGIVDAGQLNGDDEFYSQFLGQYWLAESYEQAGIDPTTWDPTQGTEFNAANITKVYEYYGQLFLDHPELEWAGMANMIGPSFAGGFYDLAMMRDVAQNMVPDGKPVLMPDSLWGTVETLARMPDSELKFYESTFLSMQKEIFEDQAPMHEAYLHGGPEEFQRMRHAGLIDRNAEGAWNAVVAGVSAGDSDRIAFGNGRLLYREQYQIIADDYDAMRARPGTGEVVTWGLTTVGTPSIPGAQAYPEVFPETVPLQVPLPGAPFVFVPTPFDVETPFPDGNIADRDQRWGLITEDTLPAYREALSSDTAAARQLIASEFGPRLEERRIAHQAPVLLERILTDWSVGLR